MVTIWRRRDDSGGLQPAFERRQDQDRQEAAGDAAASGMPVSANATMNSLGGFLRHGV
jgi:hypothetical protein